MRNIVLGLMAALGLMACYIAPELQVPAVVVLVHFLHISISSFFEFTQSKKRKEASLAKSHWESGFIAPCSTHKQNCYYLFEVGKKEKVEVYHHSEDVWYDINDVPSAKVNKEGTIGLSRGRHLIESRVRVLVRVNGVCYIVDPSLKRENERDIRHERWVSRSR